MSTLYLRKFPGKRRFDKVSKDDWLEPLPFRDIAGWGHVGRLEADVRVWAPDGELVICKKWPARSYIRNFARIMRNIFGQTVQLVDRNGASVSTVMNTDAGVGNNGLIPGLFQETTNVGSTGNCEMSGLGFAIGQGVAAENHLRNDLVSRVGPIISSRNNVRTSVLNTSTTTLEVTTGVTNGQNTTINVTEIGLFLFAAQFNTGFGAVPFSTLLIYDGITSTPVATGGVIAPRYTMDYPM